jgi:hypothetical protein
MVTERGPFCQLDEQISRAISFRAKMLGSPNAEVTRHNLFEPDAADIDVWFASETG